jgi:hypothetical protein
LAELLQAAAGVVEAVSKDRGTPLPLPTLVAVRAGSAAYDFRIRDESARPVVAEIEHQIRSRAKDATPSVRHAFQRLHTAGGQTGAIRFTAYTQAGQKKKQHLYVAPPLEVVPTPFDVVAEIHGEVVGVIAGNKVTVRLRLDDGKLQDFRADFDAARMAARLFLQCIRAQIQYEYRDGIETLGEIIGIEKWDIASDHDLVAEFDRARDELLSEGVELRASDWLGEDP